MCLRNLVIFVWPRGKVPFGYLDLAEGRPLGLDGAIVQQLLFDGRWLAILFFALADRIRAFCLAMLVQDRVEGREGVADRGISDISVRGERDPSGGHGGWVGDGWRGERYGCHVKMVGFIDSTCSAYIGGACLKGSLWDSRPSPRDHFQISTGGQDTRHTGHA